MKVLDANYAKKMAKGYDLKVDLLVNPVKGVSLYAKKKIKKGNVIAYYKFKVYKYDKNFVGYKNDTYTMSVYNKFGGYMPSLVGDIYEGSLEPPKRGIPYWAYFSNEPSPDQEENCALDISLNSSNFKNKRIKPGDTQTYKLVATKDIKPGEEIVWCYGDSYYRDYKSNCK
jgi:hypothetical protein